MGIEIDGAKAGTECPVCGKGKFRAETVTHDVAHLLGLVSVQVGNLPVLKCDACGAVKIPGAFLEVISLAIAGDMLKRERLDAIEVKFLRKLLGYTQQELGKHLGVDRVTVNRWENASSASLYGTTSYALRSHVFMKLRPEARSFFDAAEKALHEQSDPGEPKAKYDFPDVCRIVRPAA
jgi:YgiT-type zinc finger domain-containing protein